MIRRVLLLLVLLVAFIGNQYRVDAQVLADCYVRRTTVDADIVCTLCGTEYEEEPSFCIDGENYDYSLCKCVEPDEDRCDGLERERIDRMRADCYAGGYFWAEPLCFCYETVVLTSTLSGVTQQTTEIKLNKVNIEVDRDKSGSFSEDIKDTVFFDTNFDGSVDNLAELIRMAFIVAFGLIAVAAAFIGFYGMGVYSTAGEDDEKVQKAQKAFKNALIGIAVSVFGILIIQVVALMFGISGGITDFSFDISNTGTP